MADGKRHYTQPNWDGRFIFDYSGLKLAMLAQIRDELRSLNQLMRCHNVTTGFRALAKIASRDEKAFKRRVEHAVAKRIKRTK